MKSKIKEWATEAINVFNPISLEFNMGYYQQSPLKVFEDSKINKIENLVIGFNPGSTGTAHVHTLESFMVGNESWKDHLKWKYFNNAHYFICGDKIEDPEGFDNDKKTVWTNLTPFGTKEKKSIEKELLEKSVPLLINLIEILNPKRIYLLGKDCFSCLEKYSSAEIIRKKIVKDKHQNGMIEIGTINGFQSIQLPHPSQGWGFHNLYMPIFVKMWKLCLNEKLSFNEMVLKMREQLTRLEPAE